VCACRCYTHLCNLRFGVAPSPTCSPVSAPAHVPGTAALGSPRRVLSTRGCASCPGTRGSGASGPPVRRATRSPAARRVAASRGRGAPSSSRGCSRGRPLVGEGAGELFSRFGSPVGASARSAVAKVELTVVHDSHKRGSKPGSVGQLVRGVARSVLRAASDRCAPHLPAELRPAVRRLTVHPADRACESCQHFDRMRGQHFLRSGGVFSAVIAAVGPDQIGAGGWSGPASPPGDAWDDYGACGKFDEIVAPDFCCPEWT